MRGKHALSPRRAEPAEPGQTERGSRSGSRPQLHRAPLPATSSGDAAPSPPMAILKESAKDSKGNQHIHALTPTCPHDVQMWNTDHKNHETTTADTQLTLRAAPQPLLPCLLSSKSLVALRCSTPVWWFVSPHCCDRSQVSDCTVAPSTS